MFRYSTHRDLVQIRTWLKEEYEQKQEGFWNNWDLIECAHQQGRLLVMLENGKAIALHTQGWLLSEDSIFVVKPSHRGHAIGSTFAEALIQSARDADVCLLTIVCAPTNSYYFWKKRGFRLFEEGAVRHGSRAYLQLDKALAMPALGYPLSVDITFADENNKGHSQSYHLTGKRLDDGDIALERRAIGFPRAPTSDVRVRVAISGTEPFMSDRARYLEEYGLAKNGGAFYLDRIVVPAKSTL